MSDVSDVGLLAGSLHLAVHRLTRRMRQHQPEDALTLTQSSALAVIWREGPMTAGELAAREQVRPPSITRVVNGLEERGMVRREANPRDARQVVVRITSAGEAQMRQTVRLHEVWLARRLADLSPHERAVLREATGLMDRLSEPDGDVS